MGEHYWPADASWLATIAEAHPSPQHRIAAARTLLLAPTSAAPPPPPGAGSPRRDGPARPPGDNQEAILTGMFDGIVTGPADQRFLPAIERLAALDRPWPRSARATARTLLPDYQWLVGAWAHLDAIAAEQTLDEICWLAVVPDIAEARVRAEIARWADELDDPAILVKALANAARRAGRGAIADLREALEPALARRWLTEHSIPARLLDDETEPRGAR